MLAPVPRVVEAHFLKRDDNFAVSERDLFRPPCRSWLGAVIGDDDRAGEPVECNRVLRKFSAGRGFEKEVEMLYQLVGLRRTTESLKATVAALFL